MPENQARCGERLRAWRYLSGLLLIAHNYVFITDPNYENEIAGYGLFITLIGIGKIDRYSLESGYTYEDKQGFAGKISYSLVDRAGKEVASDVKLNIRKGTATSHIGDERKLAPHLWTPESPYL